MHCFFYSLLQHYVSLSCRNVTVLTIIGMPVKSLVHLTISALANLLNDLEDVNTSLTPIHICHHVHLLH